MARRTNNTRDINLLTFLAYVASTIETEGEFMSRKRQNEIVSETWDTHRQDDAPPRLTAEIAYEAMLAEAPLKRGAKTTAKATLAHFQSMDWSVPQYGYMQSLFEALLYPVDDLRSFEVRAYKNISTRQLNLVASAVPSYQRDKGRKEADEAKAAKIGETSYFGAVGDRVEFDCLEVIESRHVRDYDSYVHTLSDGKGHVFTLWRDENKRLDVGERVAMRATIKRHSEFRGMKQTALNRPFNVAFLNPMGG